MNKIVLLGAANLYYKKKDKRVFGERPVPQEELQKAMNFKTVIPDVTRKK